MTIVSVKEMNRETCQQDQNTRIKMVNTEKQEHFKQIETQNNGNRNVTHQNTEQTRIQEGKIIETTIKGMMSEKKTTQLFYT